MKLKIIKMYGPKHNRQYFTEEKSDSDCLEVKFDERQYLIDRKDFTLPDMPERENILGMPIPRSVYKMVYCSPHTKEAMVERVFEGRLIKGIMENFCGCMCD